MKINCDVGEGLDDIDAQLLPQIDMASIACGGHAGNHESMQRTVAIAAKSKVSIGAHPSYPDQENFGRISLSIPPDTLLLSLKEQTQRLFDAASSTKASVDFIKPHGALYNDCVKDPSIRGIVLALAETFSLPLVLQALPNIKEHSLYHADLAASKTRIIFEAFADRAYQNNGQLVSRSKDHAVLSSVDTIVERANTLLRNKTLASESGEPLNLNVDTLCVHSDSENALDIVRGLKGILRET